MFRRYTTNLFEQICQAQERVDVGLQALGQFNPRRLPFDNLRYPGILILCFVICRRLTRIRSLMVAQLSDVLDLLIHVVKFKKLMVKTVSNRTN